MKSACVSPSEPLLIRTRRLRNPRDHYLFAKRSIFKLFGGEWRFIESIRRGVVENMSATDAQSWTARAKRFVLSLLYTPDEDLGWLPFAIVKAVRVVRAHGVIG